jgi:hypothetical protein
VVTKTGLNRKPNSLKVFGRKETKAQKSPQSTNVAYAWGWVALVLNTSYKIGTINLKHK